MPPFPNGVLNVASAADVGDSLFTRELAKKRIREERSEWSDMDLNRERIRRALLQRLVPALERIIMGRMSAGCRYLDVPPSSPNDVEALDRRISLRESPSTSPTCETITTTSHALSPLHSPGARFAGVARAWRAKSEPRFGYRGRRKRSCRRRRPRYSPASVASPSCQVRDRNFRPVRTPVRSRQFVPDPCREGGLLHCKLLGRTRCRFRNRNHSIPSEGNQGNGRRARIATYDRALANPVAGATHRHRCHQHPVPSHSRLPQHPQLHSIGGRGSLRATTRGGLADLPDDHRPRWTQCQPAPHRPTSSSCFDRRLPFHSRRAQPLFRGVRQG